LWTIELIVIAAMIAVNGFLAAYEIALASVSAAGEGPRPASI
jgi:CBS domain containing-hemolysin-like protein